MGALHNPVAWSQLSRASSTLGRFHRWHDLAQLAQAQRPSSYASHAQWLMTDGTLRSWPESSSACTDAVARRSCHGSRSDGSAGCCQTSSAKLPKSLQRPGTTTSIRLLEAPKPSSRKCTRKGIRPGHAALTHAGSCKLHGLLEESLSCLQYGSACNISSSTRTFLSTPSLTPLHCLAFSKNHRTPGTLAQDTAFHALQACKT